MGRKAAAGTGTIRKKTVTRSGKQYTYWEARFTAGYDPGTGKQVQRSITGKTQKEVAQKLKAATAAIDQGTYIAPCKLTVGEWLDTWAADYLGGVKPTTVKVYKNNLQRHIKPVLGAVVLSELRPHMVQKFINGMELSSSSVRLAYKVLHQALEKAVKLEYISRNPAAGCELPRLEQKEIHPLEDQQVAALLRAVKGGRLELLVSIALFTGLRQSELLGLTWDCVDFQKGTLLVNKQLSRILHREESGLFLSPKSGKSRTITPAPSVLKTLKEQRRRQAEMQLKAGSLWNNAHNLVFTNETGGPLEQWRVEKDYQAAVEAVGLAGARFHDLRHTYAVNAIRAGDDIKTIQGNQLSRILHREESGLFLSPKSGKSRTITPAPSVLKTLKEQRRRQAEMQLKAGSLWNNAHNLVFTNETGGPLEQWRVEKDYQAAVEAVGLAGARFHDLRHTYAVNAIRAGDDIKTIQGNLGHASAAFTLDRYGHFTERMRQDSAARMEGFIKGVLGL